MDDFNSLATGEGDYIFVRTNHSEKETVNLSDFDEKELERLSAEDCIHMGVNPDKDVEFAVSEINIKTPIGEAPICKPVCQAAPARKNKTPYVNYELDPERFTFYDDITPEERKAAEDYYQGAIKIVPRGNRTNDDNDSSNNNNNNTNNPCSINDGGGDEITVEVDEQQYDELRRYV